MSDLAFRLFLALAIPVLFLPVGIALHKGRNVGPVIALSLAFWPAALALALRTRRGMTTPPLAPASRDRLGCAERPASGSLAMHDPHQDTPHQDTPHQDTPHRETPHRDTPYDGTPHGHSHDAEAPGAVTERWKHDGVRVIPGDKLDANTAQTPGMVRQAAINHARVGAQKIWAGTVAIEPDAKTGVHHHGALESVIFVLSGRARMRWGDRLEYVAEAGPGDFIFVPPFVPHQEINASPDETLQCVLVRSDNEAVVVNIPDVEPVERPEAVHWVDPIHKHP